MDDYWRTLSPGDRYISLLDLNGSFTPDELRHLRRVAQDDDDDDDVASYSSSIATNPPTVFSGAESGDISARWYAAHQDYGEYDDGPYIFPTAAERRLELYGCGSRFWPA